MNKYFVITIKTLFALHLIIFGLNKFLLFFMPPPPSDPQAQAFMMGMFGSYLGTLVGSIEIIGGILLLIPRTSFIGFLALLPIVVNIIGYHVAHDLPGNGIWIFTLLASCLIIYAEKHSFQKLVQNELQ